METETETETKFDIGHNRINSLLFERILEDPLLPFVTPHSRMRSHTKTVRILIRT